MSKFQIVITLIGSILLVLGFIDYANDKYGRNSQEIYTGMVVAVIVILFGLFI